MAWYTAWAYLSRVADHLSDGVRLPAPRHLVGDLERRSGVRRLCLGLGHSRAAEAALACARTQHTARVGAPGTDEAAEVHRVINSAAGVCGWGARLGCVAEVRRTACGLVETIDLLDLRRVDALEHQLGHTVADLDCRDGTRAAERQRPGRSLRASALSPQPAQAGSDLGVGRVRWRGRAAGRTMEVVVAVVEEDHSHVAAVVGVDHARPRVDEVLPCQARARRCTPRKAQASDPRARKSRRGARGAAGRGGRCDEAPAYRRGRSSPRVSPSPGQS